jgi:hypothetical protein
MLISAQLFPFSLLTFFVSIGRGPPQQGEGGQEEEGGEAGRQEEGGSPGASLLILFSSPPSL